MKKKLIITGASGFIGSHCLDILIDNGNFEIHALEKEDMKKGLRGVHWHKTDLVDSKRIYGILGDIKASHLLHFAWYAVPGKYWTSVENLTMVQASLNLLKHFAHHGGQRAVMAGSCAEYDWRYGFCSESVTPLVPSSLYGSCKSSLQHILDAFSLQTGISTAWGRIFYLYGPREHHSRLVPSVVCSLLQERPARCSHGNQIRDFMYVKDIAAAFIALLESDVRGAVNIGSGNPIRLKDIILTIAYEFGRQDLVQLGVLPASENEPPLIVADNKRLTEEVGWIPKYSLKEGLKETIAWWENNIESITFNET